MRHSKRVTVVLSFGVIEGVPSVPSTKTQSEEKVLSLLPGIQSLEEPRTTQVRNLYVNLKIKSGTKQMGTICDRLRKEGKLLFSRTYSTTFSEKRIVEKVLLRHYSRLFSPMLLNIKEKFYVSNYLNSTTPSQKHFHEKFRSYDPPSIM